MAQAYGSAFAQFYDRQSTVFAEQAASQIYEFYLGRQHASSSGNMLDLCCGTGQLARFFLERGFTVTGLDLSEPMLAMARKNAGDYLTLGAATFVQADASHFILRTPLTS
jgi:ubiquinone/menaquinone biosynthesis C-methylase UbiE